MLKQTQMTVYDREATEPGVWVFDKPTQTWELQAKSCFIWMQARPAHCDRGRWLAHVERIPGTDPADLHISDADFWPRYYFDLIAAKSECEAWLRAKKQIE
jgi:hypothetical protein